MEKGLKSLFYAIINKKLLIILSLINKKGSMINYPEFGTY